jgi:hypothetical protein
LNSVFRCKKRKFPLHTQCFKAYHAKSVVEL